MVIAYICLALCIIFNILSCSLLTASDGLTRPLQSSLGIFLALLNYFVLAKAIVYLLGPNAAFLTGEVLGVDGGQRRGELSNAAPDVPEKE